MKKAAYFINLDKRPDRLENVKKQVAASNVLSDWNPRRLAAFSAENTARPSWYCQTHGFWASKRSHLEALERGILEDLDLLMVIEDDIRLERWNPIVPSFDQTFEYILPRLPEGWMGVQFGGYHVSPPTQISPGIVRLWRFFECPLALYSRKGIRFVYDEVTAMPNSVFDWALMDLYHKEAQFFAPEILPVGQIHSWSDNVNYHNH